VTLSDRWVVLSGTTPPPPTIDSTFFQISFIAALSINKSSLSRTVQLKSESATEPQVRAVAL